MSVQMAQADHGMGLNARPKVSPARDQFNLPGHVLHVGQDQEIYGDGEAADKMFRVVSGWVRTCKFLNDGRRQIDAFYGPGEIFGLEAGGRYSLSAEAVSDCDIVSYRRGNFSEAAAGNKELAGQVVSLAMRHMQRAQRHALLLGRRGAVERVAGFLLDQAAGAPDRGITLSMTRHDIADYLGLTTETVSRTLTQLEHDGVLTLRTARQIGIKDLAALQDLAEGMSLTARETTRKPLC